MVAVPSWLETLNVAVSIHDPETADIRYANPALGKLIERPPSEIESMDIGEFSSATFTQAEAVQRVRAAADGDPQVFEWRERTASGKEVWTKVRLSPMETDTGTFVIAIITPLTKYKESRRWVKFLTRAVRHDLRTHVQIIDGASDMRSTDAAADEWSNRLQNSIDHLLRLTARLNDLKQIADDKPRTPLNLGDLVTDVVTPYRHQYTEIEWQITPADIHAMASQPLRIAVDELVDNAVSHNPHADLCISISVSENAAENQANIRIADTGHPIPSMEIEPITEAYNPEPLSHGEGTGLWLVQSMVTSMYGRLSVPENSAERTVFDICLPLPLNQPEV
jgi:PAS domain S-box-containing protein